MNRKHLIIISIILSLGTTITLYWPLPQRVTLSNQKSNVDREVENVKLDIDADIKEIVSGLFRIPLDRHEICLWNRNGFHFIHSDSSIPDVPLPFYTNDLNQIEYGQKYQLGAMAVRFYYLNQPAEPILYREFGSSIQCETLEYSKLKNYASSTIEYRYAGLETFQELDLGKNGKVGIIRPIVGGYFINTQKTYLIITPRWKFFLFTFVTLFFLFAKLVKYVHSNRQKLFPTFIKWIKKLKTND